MSKKSGKKTKRLSTADAERITVIANAMANRLIAGESLRLALPIADRTASIIRAQYKRIEEKYGEV